MGRDARNADLNLAEERDLIWTESLTEKDFTVLGWQINASWIIYVKSFPHLSPRNFHIHSDIDSTTSSINPLHTLAITSIRTTPLLHQRDDLIFTINHKRTPHNGRNYTFWRTKITKTYKKHTIHHDFKWSPPGALLYFPSTPDVVTRPPSNFLSLLLQHKFLKVFPFKSIHLPI